MKQEEWGLSILNGTCLDNMQTKKPAEPAKLPDILCCRTLQENCATQRGAHVDNMVVYVEAMCAHNMQRSRFSNYMISPMTVGMKPLRDVSPPAGLA